MPAANICSETVEAELSDLCFNKCSRRTIAHSSDRSFVGRGMELEVTLACEIRQAQKNKDRVFPLTSAIKKEGQRDREMT